jgi:hypothetical protein
MNGKDRAQRERSPHLFPEEAGQTHPTSPLTAQAEQAGEHDEKQGDVSSNHRDEVDYAAACV